MAAAGWTKVMIVIGLSAAMLGLVLSTLIAPLDYPEKAGDYTDMTEYAKACQSEQDNVKLFYLIGSIFIHIGAGLILFSLFIGYVMNESLSANNRMFALIIMIAAFVIWFVFAAGAVGMATALFNNPVV